MTKEQLLQIAIAGYPLRSIKFFNLSDYDIFEMSGVYRLYDKNEGFFLALPRKSILTISHNKPDNWVQFTTVPSFSFNHLKAIRKME